MAPFAASALPSSSIVMLALPRPCQPKALRLNFGQLTGRAPTFGTDVPVSAWQTTSSSSAAWVESMLARNDPTVKPPDIVDGLGCGAGTTTSLAVAVAWADNACVKGWNL